MYRLQLYPRPQARAIGTKKATTTLPTPVYFWTRILNECRSCLPAGTCSTAQISAVCWSCCSFIQPRRFKGPSQDRRSHHSTCTSSARSDNTALQPSREPGGPATANEPCVLTSSPREDLHFRPRRLCSAVRHTHAHSHTGSFPFDGRVIKTRVVATERFRTERSEKRSRARGTIWRSATSRGSARRRRCRCARAWATLRLSRTASASRPIAMRAISRSPTRLSSRWRRALYTSWLW